MPSKDPILTESAVTLQEWRSLILRSYQQATGPDTKGRPIQDLLAIINELTTDRAFLIRAHLCEDQERDFKTKVGTFLFYSQFEKAG